MEGCSRDAGRLCGPKRVASDVWDSPPPGVVDRLVGHEDIVPWLRLLNSAWRREVDGVVKHARLRTSNRFPGVKKAVSVLTKFPCIDTLTVQNNRGYRIDLAPLTAISKLTTLNLVDARRKRMNIDAFRCLTSLEKLSLRVCRIESIRFVARLTGLVELQLRWKQKLNYRILSRLTKLSSLDLSHSKLWGNPSTCLSGLVNLKALSLESPSAYHAFTGYVVHLTNLTRLNLGGFPLEEERLGAITSLRGLEYLHIGNGTNKLANAYFLIDLRILKELVLDCWAQNGVMQSIASVELLTSLSLNVSYITNDIFSLLTSLCELETLLLFKPRRKYVSNVCRHWTCIPNLIKLVLSGVCWVKESFLGLSVMKNLKELDLSGVSGTNHEMQPKGRLALRSKRVTECKESLKHALPFCKIL